MSALAGVAQFCGVAFWLITAIYALLASQTFAYEQFLRPKLMPALAWFADSHRVMTAVVLVAFVGLHVLAGTTRRRIGAITLTVVSAIWFIAAVALAMLPPLAALAPGGAADAAVLVALVPVLLVAVVDLATAPALEATPPRERHVADFVACLLAAIASAGVSAVVALVTGATFERASATGIVSSSLLHLVAFLAVFLCLAAVRSIGVLAASRRVEAVCAALLLAIAIGLFLARTMFPSVVSDPGRQLTLSMAFALALSVAVIARGLRVSSHTDDGLVRLTAGLSPRVAERAAGFVAWLVVLAVGAWLGSRVSRMADWNFVLADLVVVSTWLLMLAASLRVVRLSQAGRMVSLYAITAVIFAVNAAWTRTAHATPTSDATSSGQWIVHAPGARLLSDAVSRSADSADEDLVDLLHAHTNLPASANVPPVDITLAPVTPRQPYRPHIFLFVIDSLRRDYVGAYNPSVSFTPSLDQLAREGVAFTQAFTRYGATGLAVPSIWTGSMLLHKQYVRPFPPMNTLAKLLAGQEYAQWASMDHILDTILPPSDRRDPLDTDRTVKDFRLCRTLGEIRGRLATRPADADPVFVYTLPQDIHVSAVAREGATALDSTAYPGFHAPVASRIAAFDACFGAFVADLQARGLYDDSVIIVTSDHGDSLGEEGRVGHAYTLYPEIVRIPLVVRLPPRLAADREAENEGPVFSTDIAPTLYSLLGRVPAQPRPFFGRPLFRTRGAVPRGSEGAIPVVAASYGAVYAALLDDGATLYVLDTINLRDQVFRLPGGGPATEMVATAEHRRVGQRAIRATVMDIAGYFGYGSEP